MSEDVLKYYLVCQATSGWKNRFKKSLPAIESFDVNGNKLGYPKWNVISFSGCGDINSGSIEARLKELEKIGYKESYASLLLDTTGETIYYIMSNGSLMSVNSEKSIQKRHINAGLDDNHNFFDSETKYNDKLLIKLKPRTKKIFKALETYCQNYIGNPTPEEYNKLKLFIDSESEEKIRKSKLTSVLDFPNIKPHSNAPVDKSPEGLSRNLCYFYNDSEYAYLGFSHNDLSPYLNEECNYFYKEEVEHVAYLIEAFDFISTTKEGRARTQKRRKKESIFFNAGGSMYYQEQKVLPESVWGVIENS